MEFQIMNPQEVAALPQVRWNFEEIKRYAIEKADEYKGIAYTEDDAAAMKSDRADINRFIKAIEAERIKKKKEYLEPYNVFEAQVKEVLQPLREAEAVIAKGLKEIDDKWRGERFMTRLSDTLGKSLRLTLLTMRASIGSQSR